MGVHFVIDLERLEALVAGAHALSEDLDRSLARLDAAVDSLGLTWSGRAAEAHLRAHRAWARGATELRAGLVALERVAHGAHAAYAGAAEANAQLWRPLR